MIRQLRAPLIACAAIVIVLLGVNRAAADPSTETTLPADGVVSIVHPDASTWTTTFDVAPSEYKVISNPQLIVCGVNFGIPCSTVETFTWAHGDCLYSQVDWAGQHNSSDPYVCRPIATASPTPIPTGGPTSAPSPSSTPTASSTPMPSDTPIPTVTAAATASPAPTSIPGPTSTPATVKRLGHAVQISNPTPSKVAVQVLAATGDNGPIRYNVAAAAAVILGIMLVGLLTIIVSLRAQARRRAAEPIEDSLSTIFGHDDDGDRA